MKLILCIPALIALCNAPVNAQIFQPSPFVTPSDAEWSKRNEMYVYNEGLAYYWWMCTYPQVRDKVVAEPGWNVYALDEDFDTYNGLLATNKRNKTSLVFFFSKPRKDRAEMLFRRRFIYAPDSPMIDEWAKRLAKLPYDKEKECWVDTEHYALIVKGQDESAQTVYELTLYYPKSSAK